jgi:murein DD-endopeptidase MepM/ murein hydrolase activator NlpD
LLLACVLALATAAPLAVAGLTTESEGIDTRIERLREEIERAKQRETVLTSDIAAAREQIDVIQGEVDALAAKVEALELELARHRARLEELRRLYAEQTRHLAISERGDRIAQERLEQRLVELYQTDFPDEIEILFASGSLDDVISGIEYLNQIARQDERIAEDVARAKRELAAARRETAATKAAEAETTALLAERTAEQGAALDGLVARRDQLVSAQGDRQALLTTVRGGRREAQEDLDALERESAVLASRIRSVQSGGAGGGTPSASGFIWPVNGPITSPFGQRWGRLHAGVDIGAGFGTPIHAAASGTVIHAGWLGGYGNLVVVDHGGGLSTAYAHQQRIYVGVGAAVGQGQVLGEVGSTGYSFGAHLHFEVRVNGSPVDPLGYL